MRVFPVLFLLILVLAPPSALAGEPSGLELTVYNDNLALVKELRDLDLKRGVGEYQFTGVPERLLPETVRFLSLTDPDGTRVLEQNYRYDLLDRGSLLERYRGQEVRALVDGEWRDVRLLAHGQPASDGQAVGRILEIDGEIHIEGFILPELPEGLLLEPTLVWLLESRKSGRQKVELDYLTAGLGWRADYVAVIDEDNMLDLNAWVTLDNRSGRSYENANLKLVAGDVNRVRQDYGAGRSAKGRPEMMALSGNGGGFQEENFFEYHLYTLERPTTVLDREQKQIELFSAEKIQAKRKYVFESQRWQEDREPRPVAVKLEFENSEKQGLGLPLPEGILRAYQADKQGRLQFAGEDRIRHTPKDEMLRLKLGDAFDLRGERVKLGVKQDRQGHVTEQSFRIRLRNHKEDDVEIVVREQVASYEEWRILTSTHPHEKKSSRWIEFSIDVPADEEITLEYTVRLGG